MNEISNGWFSEIGPIWPGRALSIQITATLYSARSKYQRIDVYQTAACGKMLVLDGAVQCTESDEFAYQEMLTHVPLFCHPRPERVLVIGGGDGGVIREVGRHTAVQSIDLCEIDEAVIKVAKRFMPGMACGFADRRVRIQLRDGAEFIKERKQYYDVIIVDSSDPSGPAAGLFRRPFYADLKRALRAGGIIATQAESIFLQGELVAALMKIAASLFPVRGYCWFLVPTYPGGNIGACVASLGPAVNKPVRRPGRKMQAQLRYYSPAMHRSAFVLPSFAAQILAGMPRSALAAV